MKKFHPKCTQCKCNTYIYIYRIQSQRTEWSKWCEWMWRFAVWFVCWCSTNSNNNNNNGTKKNRFSCLYLALVLSLCVQYTQLQVMHDFWREVCVCKCDFMFMYAKRFYFNWYSLWYVFLCFSFFLFFCSVFFLPSFSRIFLKMLGSFGSLAIIVTLSRTLL